MGCRLQGAVQVSAWSLEFRVGLSTDTLKPFMYTCRIYIYIYIYIDI